MMKAYKSFFSAMVMILLVAIVFNPAHIVAESNIQFSEEEEEFISRTQNGDPITMGIIPHAFPLSECPPETKTFDGTNIEMIKLISKKTGLKFKLGRIPLEKKSPYESLMDKDFMFVAGTIKLDNFTNNPDLLLSDRFDDGSLICISKKNTDPNILKTGKISILRGYQAGQEYATKQFPSHEVVYYENNKQVIEAVSSGNTDIAMISRYVGIYELQSPLNEDLSVISPYQVEIDSCIMGINNNESKLAMSIINKGLSEISKNEYNNIQMSFSITHPYEPSIPEMLYENRLIITIGSIATLILVVLLRKLFTSQKDKKALSRDSLTGSYTEAGFELAVSKIINKSNKNLYITEFDLSNFSTYNELHGKEQGDKLLISIAKIVGTFLSEQDIICRSYADNFKVLTCKENIDELLNDIKQANKIFNEMVDNKMIFSFGIYPIKDVNVPITKMLDFASIARKNAKRRNDCFIDIFDEELYKTHMAEVKMVEYFDSAIANKEFVAYYQPKFDTYTKKLVGAEALVRWKTKTGTMLMPVQFIELFEKNGLIQKLDFYMLKEVCVLLRKLMDQGKEIIPISVNFSRVHLFTADFIEKIIEMVEYYDIPKQYIEVECTETAMTYDSELSKEILGKLREAGFEIAMDDFGKGYSSLNALSSMPLDIVKLDSGFLSTALEFDKDRSNKVISGVVSLVHDLSLKIIAEGVETEEQYLFLKSVGCDYIQGYYFSKPLEEEIFLKMLI